MLDQLLRAAAAAAPDELVVLTPSSSRTYGECQARAEALARGLTARGVTRFGVQLADAAELVAVLAAAAAVGSEPCVYPAAADDAAVSALTTRLDHRVVVADRSIGAVEVVAPDDLAIGEGPPAPPGEAAPLLVLTTGTTGEPKAARHDWRRLARGASGRTPQPGARWLLGYDLNQFAGTQLLAHVIATQATLVVSPSPWPRDAPAIMRDLGVTHVSATPTFWRLALSSIDPADAAALPLVQVTLGGEAVPRPLLDQLTTLFPTARVSQVYATTELGSLLSVRDLDNGLPLDAIERELGSGVAIEVRDGELWVRSEVGMLGYYGEPEVDTGWRPTGDLVEVEDGRLRFVGRTSERINVGGVKVHPLPIEEVVGGVPGVALVRARGKANPVTGEIVVVDVVPAPGADPDQLDAAIRAACRVLPSAAQPRLVRFVDDLEVRGQKMRRNKDGNA